MDILGQLLNGATSEGDAAPAIDTERAGGSDSACPRTRRTAAVAALLPAGARRYQARRAGRQTRSGRRDTGNAIQPRRTRTSRGRQFGAGARSSARAMSADSVAAQGVAANRDSSETILRAMLSVVAGLDRAAGRATDGRRGDRRGRGRDPGLDPRRAAERRQLGSAAPAPVPAAPQSTPVPRSCKRAARDCLGQPVGGAGPGSRRQSAGRHPEYGARPVLIARPQKRLGITPVRSAPSALPTPRAAPAPRRPSAGLAWPPAAMRRCRDAPRRHPPARSGGGRERR